MEWVIAIGVVIVLTAFGWYAWQKACVYRVLADARLLVDEYKARCNEVNRFVINEKELKKVYPSSSESVIREVWKQLIAERLVDRDPMDGEWCIRK